MSKSPKISQKTVDNPEHNAYNSGVKRNRNSSGQGDMSSQRWKHRFPTDGDSGRRQISP